jgi:hypothetical protein
LILIDALSSACWEKNKKEIKNRKRKKWLGGYFSQGQTCIDGCAMQDFHG